MPGADSRPPVTPDQSAQRRRPLRVVGWPAYTTPKNPYNRSLYEALEAIDVEVIERGRLRMLLGSYDILHIHWPNFDFPIRRHTVWGVLRIAVHALYVPISLAIVRLRGIKIIWTIHNLEAHDARWPRLARAYDRLLVRLIHGYISLTSGARAEAEQRFPHLRNLSGFVIPHGHYRDAYPPKSDRRAARDRLQLPPDARIALFFGAIWRYKNVPRLIAAIEECTGRDLLIVAGPPIDARIRDEVQKLVDRGRRTRLYARFISPEEASVFFGAADLVVNAGETFLNSGSLILALSLGTPVLAQDRSAARELRALFGETLVHLYEGALTGATLQSTLEQVVGCEARVPPAAIDALSWPRIAELTRDAYYSTLGRVNRDRVRS